MKRNTELLITTGIVFLIVGGILFFLFGKNQKETEDIAYYRSLSEETEDLKAHSLMGSVECPFELPLLRELEPYEDYRFNYTAMRYSIFQSHAYILILEYDEENYAQQKSVLAQKYTYCTADSACVEVGVDIMEDGTVYKMDDFELRAVEGNNYPKEMLFIGTSDTRQEIAIVYFYDFDLDSVMTPFGKFLAEYTGWDKVVKK